MISEDPFQKSYINFFPSNVVNEEREILMRTNLKKLEVVNIDLKEHLIDFEKKL